MKRGQHRRRDYTGQTFGYLTAMEDAGTTGQKRKWRLRCRCGNVVVKVIGDLRSPTSSCGCMVGKNGTHGMTSHPAYSVWRSMNDRCRLPTHQAWRNYGGRGITVCARWQQDFENFWADMGSSYVTGLTLDRENNNGNYAPDNCRWVTYAVQAGNRRGSLPVDIALAHALTHAPKSTLLYRWNARLSMTSATPDPDRVSWSEVMRGR